MRIPLSERLGSDLKRVEQQLMAEKSVAVKPSGLTVPQFAALLILEQSPGISAAELARRCAVTPQTMTTVLHNLSERGLIERTVHPLHRNVLETRPTQAGQAALEAADERASAVERRLLDAFSAEERVTLRALLERCSQALTQHSPY